MQTIERAAAAFLANERIVVTGVSAGTDSDSSNFVYQRLR